MASASSSTASGSGAVALSSAVENPYAGHAQLSEKEQDLLGEYARLASTVRRIANLSTSLASNDRHGDLLTDLRILERKMGLVLTLFKASVWSLIQSHQDEVLTDEAQQGHDDDDNDVGMQSEEQWQR